MWIVLEFIEFNKLDNISFHLFSVSVWIERNIISIESVHGRKIFFSNSNNDDCKRQSRAPNNFINSFVHIIYQAISDDYTNVELLFLLVCYGILYHIIDFFQNMRKMWRTIKVWVVQSMIISGCDSFQAIHTWVENVTVHSKAVWNSLVIWCHCTSKAIKLYLLVCIVELEDVSYALYGLQVLVFRWIQVVEGVRHCWVSIWDSEINCNC